jgi:membrane-associated phospholipid phosphatase
VFAPLTFELLAAAFFAVFALVALTARAAPRRRMRTALLSAGFAGMALAAGQAGNDVRGWLGHAYLVAGYWIPALLVSSPAVVGRFESWLVRTDERWRRAAFGPPVWARPFLELSYLLCYVLVPLAFAIVWTAGTLADVDRFWTAVLLAGFLCYGSLPWLVSRPPRSLDATARMSAGVQGVNDRVLARVSHGLNTFPSGHVAVSLAAALQVMPMSRPAGIGLLVVAASISIGAIVGRYHYAADVALGAAIGIGVSQLI